MRCSIIPAHDAPLRIGPLFKEYTDYLTEADPSVREYLQIQAYDSELDHLAEKYGPPSGRLYLAVSEGLDAGCIGLRRLGSETGEIKRLYVRPRFRGCHIGGQLMEKVIQDAKIIGYTSLFLDTLPFLESAVRLYRRYGFYEIPCYNDSPLDASIHMRLDL